MNKVKAEQEFTKITREKVSAYNTYWQTLIPKSDEDVFKRYLFTFCSVHTTWSGNLRGYNALKDLGWLRDKNDLRERLTKARCGMQNARTKFIWDFKEKFFDDPKYFYEMNDASWTDFRNKLVKEINGIGMAKVSFVLEMIYPLEAQISCLDTHSIQLYELPVVAFKSKKEVELYQEVEKHWVDKSNEYNVSAYVSRSIFWDLKQGYEDNKYWAHVLET